MRHKALARRPPRGGAGKGLTPQDYKRISEFRHLLRQFLSFSEAAARTAGLSPQQHQALLAIKGFSGALTIRELAARLAIRHNTAVELVGRLVTAGLLLRAREEEDRRKVLLRLTPKANALLEKLTRAHRDELRRLGPLMAPLMAPLLRQLSR